jgi:hypothetical protein
LRCVSERAEPDGVRVVLRAAGYLLNHGLIPILLLGAEAQDTQRKMIGLPPLSRTLP